MVEREQNNSDYTNNATRKFPYQLSYSALNSLLSSWLSPFTNLFR